MQYARHRLVINTILLSVGILIVITLFGWWQLYGVGNTSALAYRVTQVLPLPVATVDGESVRYSDYLVRYRSEIYWLEQNNQINLSTSDGQRQAEYRKRQSLDEAVANAYAEKLARQQHVTITDAQINDFVTNARQAQGVSISEDAYYSAQYDAYGWSKQEVRQNIKSSLLRRAVSFSIDTDAQATATSVETQAMVTGSDLTQIAAAATKAGAQGVSAVDAGTIPLNSQDANGIIATIQGYAPNQVSGIIKGVGGYYIARLIDKTSTQIHYQYVEVDLTKFDANLKALRDSGKIAEYIKVQASN